MRYYDFRGSNDDTKCGKKLFIYADFYANGFRDSRRSLTTGGVSACTCLIIRAVIANEISLCIDILTVCYDCYNTLTQKVWNEFE